MQFVITNRNAGFTFDDCMRLMQLRPDMISTSFDAKQVTLHIPVIDAPPSEAKAFSISKNTLYWGLQWIGTISKQHSTTPELYLCDRAARCFKECLSITSAPVRTSTPVSASTDIVSKRLEDKTSSKINSAAQAVEPQSEIIKHDIKFEDITPCFNIGTTISSPKKRGTTEKRRGSSHLSHLNSSVDNPNRFKFGSTSAFPIDLKSVEAATEKLGI